MPPEFALLLLAGIAAANAIVALYSPRDLKSEASLALLFLLIAITFLAVDSFLPLVVAQVDALG